MVQLVEVCRLSEYFFRGEYLSKYFTSDEKCYFVTVLPPFLIFIHLEYQEHPCEAEGNKDGLN